MTVAHVLALVLLIVSLVFAIINPGNLQNPLLWAVWAAVVLYVLGALLGQKLV